MGYDIEKLTQLFREFQSMVEKHAIHVTPTQVVYSNLLNVTVEPGQNALGSYLRQARDLILESATYRQLSDAVTKCYRDALPPVDIDPEVQKMIEEDGEEFWNSGYTPPQYPYEVMAEWLEVHDFYGAKILGGDKSCWVDQFRRFIEMIPETLNRYHCFLAVDELQCGPIRIGNAQLIGPSDTDALPLENLPGYQRLQCELDPWTENPEDITYWSQGGKGFYYLHRTVELTGDFYSGEKAPEAGQLAESHFGPECLALQLVSKNELGFPNAFVIPLCESKIYEFSSIVSQRITNLSFANNVYLDHSEACVWFKQITVGEDKKEQFTSLVNRVLDLTKRLGSAMGSSLDLYMAASKASGPIAFLLFVITIESVVLGKSQSELKEKFCHRFARMLSSNPETQQRIYSIGQKLYKCRSDIVHGNKPDLLTVSDPRNLQKVSDVTLGTLRDYTRRLIIVTLLALDAISTEGTLLNHHFVSSGEKIPSNSSQLADCYSRFAFDVGWWEALYASVEANYAKTPGFDTVFVD